MKKLTLEELILKKHELEKDLLVSIVKFKKETSMDVWEIKLKALAATTSVGKPGEVVKVDVVIGI